MPTLRNITCLATCSSGKGPSDADVIENAALVWTGDRIQWVGPEADLPEQYRGEFPMDAAGALVVPGLIDCHTHLAFGGWRADEFELRSRGATYLDIARQGGGILSTVRETRRTSEDDLLQRVRDFGVHMLRLGVTTVECKSGYGLNLDDELKLLQVYRRLAEEGPINIVATLLAAHTVPEEFRDDRSGYVDEICSRIIPQVAAERLAEFCDVFVEESAFSVDEGRRVLAAAAEHGLRAKLHADQLTDGGGAALAAEMQAASADHLECISDAGATALSKADVVAVTLPIASLYLRQRPLDARRLIDAGARVAVATDFNPGSAPSYHLPLAMTLACIMNGLTPTEALRAATINAAAAINREHLLGSLERGKQADFVLVEAGSINEWLYHFRPNSVLNTFIRGRIVYEARRN
jgi:imidazolonepropionase